MTLEVTDSEQQLLLEVIEERQKRCIQELDHTDSREYRAILRERLTILEKLLSKIQQRAI